MQMSRLSLQSSRQAATAGSIRAPGSSINNVSIRFFGDKKKSEKGPKGVPKDLETEGEDKPPKGKGEKKKGEKKGGKK
jgi:hypothetical protein